MGQVFAKAKKEGEMVRPLQPNMHVGRGLQLKAVGVCPFGDDDPSEYIAAFSWVVVHFVFSVELQGVYDYGWTKSALFLLCGIFWPSSDPK